MKYAPNLMSTLKAALSPIKITPSIQKVICTLKKTPMFSSIKKSYRINTTRSKNNYTPENITLFTNLIQNKFEAQTKNLHGWASKMRIFIDRGIPGRPLYKSFQPINQF